MNFYSMLFAVVFLAGVQLLVRSVAMGDRITLAMAATLSLLVLNDTLYTSHALESRPRQYSLAAKFIDLLGFVLLSSAVVLASPRHNLFADVSEQLPPDWGGRGPAFWALITLYWAVSLSWNRLVEHVTAQRLYRWSWGTYILVAPFCAMVLISGLASGRDATELGGLTVASIVFLYVFVYKPLAWNPSGATS